MKRSHRTARRQSSQVGLLRRGSQRRPGRLGTHSISLIPGIRSLTAHDSPTTCGLFELRYRGIGHEDSVPRISLRINGFWGRGLSLEPVRETVSPSPTIGPVAKECHSTRRMVLHHLEAADGLTLVNIPEASTIRGLLRMARGWSFETHKFSKRIFYNTLCGSLDRRPAMWKTPVSPYR